VCVASLPVMRHQKMRMYVLDQQHQKRALDGMPFITSETSMCLIGQKLPGLQGICA
jgi:hypothetical protein